MITTTNTKGQKQTQELAGWPCPKSYHQWLNVQVVTSTKLFPSKVCSGARSILSPLVSVSLMLGSSAPSARSRMPPSCAAIAVFEGRDAIQRGPGRPWERAHVNPHQSRLHLCVQLRGPSTGNTGNMWEQVQGRPQKTVTGPQVWREA